MSKRQRRWGGGRRACCHLCFSLPLPSISRNVWQLQRTLSLMHAHFSTVPSWMFYKLDFHPDKRCHLHGKDETTVNTKYIEVSHSCKEQSRIKQECWSCIPLDQKLHGGINDIFLYYQIWPSGHNICLLKKLVIQPKKLRHPTIAKYFSITGDSKEKTIYLPFANISAHVFRLEETLVK
jgi:hypothetical protein